MAFNKKYEGVPGESELWKIGNKTYLAYRVPKTSLVIGFHVVDKAQIQDLFGPGQTIRYDKEMDDARAMKAGFIHAGVREQLRLETEHPWRVFEERFATEMQVNPAYQDPKFVALVAAAALQGRDPTAAEIQTTDWYRTANDTQRKWTMLKMSDPASASELKEENRMKVAGMFRESGAWGTPVEVVNRLADFFTNGKMSSTEIARQVTAIADPNSRIPIHPSMAEFAGGVQETSQTYEQEVTDLVRTWLGPGHSWTDAQIQEWGGRFRHDASARDRLADLLGKQRLALFPEYEDPRLSYEDIAGPWRGFFNQIWGQTPDETDGVFANVIRMNDAAEAKKYLIGEGLQRGNQTVVQNAVSQLGQALGGPISADAIKA